MELDKKRIVEFIRERSHRPMKTRELAVELEIPDEDYRRFRQIVRELIRDGELIKLNRNRIGLASELDVAVGKLAVTKKGIGFLIRDDGKEDVFVPETQFLNALDGDKVMIRFTGQHHGRPAGSVIRVVERAARHIVGVFHRSKSFCFVVSDNKRIHRDILIPESDTEGAQPGEKVVVEIEYWEDPYLNPEGRVVERLGFPGDPGVDMRIIVKSYDLPEEFPADVLDEAEQVAAQSLDDEQRRRVDLTCECIYTIDPFDAKDHDDAVSVVRLDDGGYRLGVHIADVSYSVEEGTELDKEALTRGNSVYLPGMVIPMLPEVLSNDVCSLKPNRKRLAHSVTMFFDAQGKMLRWEVADTVIRSRAKLAYEEVQELFDGEGEVSSKMQKVADNLRTARELAQLLCRNRFAAGSLDFDLPEAKIVLDARGEVLELGSRVRLEAHRLVEEFMLAANKAVALEVFRHALPLIYRVHDKPDPEKVKEFAGLVSRLGYKFSVPPDITPKLFADFLKQVEGSPEEGFVNELMLRSMKKAVYQRENIGHFGLAFGHYTHFTSPIRRYPDLLVHRLLRRLSQGRYTPDFAKSVVSVIDRAAKHCSETERLAEKAERQAIKVKQVAYMARHVGEHFDGVITGVTSYGFYVRLANLGVEGLVKVSNIDDDYYRFDEAQYLLKGSRFGRVYRLGGRVRVGVLRVDTTASELDFYPAEKAETVPQRGRSVKSPTARRKPMQKDIKAARKKTQKSGGTGKVSSGRKKGKRR